MVVYFLKGTRASWAEGAMVFFPERMGVYRDEGVMVYLLKRVPWDERVKVNERLMASLVAETTLA